MQPANKREPSASQERQQQAREHRVTLKRNDTFLLCDGYADIRPHTEHAYGLYTRDTRVLSQLEFVVDGAQCETPLVHAVDDGAGLVVRYTCHAGRNVVHITRRRFLYADSVHERILLNNLSSTTLTLRTRLLYGADFADIFEVRGTRRKRHGTSTTSCDDRSLVTFHYRAVDGQTLATHLAVEPRPRHLGAEHAELELTLEPGGHQRVFVMVGTKAVTHAAREAFVRNLRTAARQRRKVLAHRVAISSDNAVFDTVLGQAWSDLRMLTTHTPHGLYPYAGTPWFSTAFGRDGIIAALLALWMSPELARGVLKFLAFYQASEEDPAREAEPGKIVHEMRHGEMARLGEVPFERYYGSIDATPLYLVLMGAYYERTGDLDTIRSLWPNAERALKWIERYGDRDGDGFVEYPGRSDGGLDNQGWKDSSDAIFDRDGRLVEGPVALCEVQGYVYAARRAVASLADALGYDVCAKTQRVAAETLRERFENAFWCEELGTYALALDGRKRPCDVVSSNAGQVLLSGIANPDRAAHVARSLWSPECYSGWGIRTLATSAARYAPDSYHNGSVWPHDNAMIAVGLARYHLTQPLSALLSALCAAAATADDRRLPELFCGYPREADEPPRPYPVACRPQAWATAALPSLLQSCLGLGWSAARRELRFTHPQLPSGVNVLTLRRLRLGDASIDVRVTRTENGQVQVDALATQGDIKLEVAP